MQKQGVSFDGKKVYMIEHSPYIIIYREGDQYSVVKGPFSASEAEYVKKSNDFAGFLDYLDKYLVDGSEPILKYTASADEVLAKEGHDPRVLEAMAYLQAD